MAAESRANKPQMAEYFVDTALMLELKRLMGLGIFTGITTNPSIIAREAAGKDPNVYLLEIASAFPDVPVSSQILKGELPDLIRAAMETAAIRPNVVVKIPSYTDLLGTSGTEDGKALELIAALKGKGVKKNVTALMSAEQAVCYMMAGERVSEPIQYVSLFFNRMKDAHADPRREIENTREFIDKYGLATEIIVGSIRAKEDIREAQISGAHIITIPPKVFWEKVLAHPQSMRFIDDAQRDYVNAFTAGSAIS